MLETTMVTAISSSVADENSATSLTTAKFCKRLKLPGTCFFNVLSTQNTGPKCQFIGVKT